jgi:HSP20 family molecular chaperone IbpA
MRGEEEEIYMMANTNMARRDPFSDLTASWQRDIERMFQGLTESFGGFGGMASQKSGWLPATDILTKGDDLVIRVELPGIDPERDVEITVEDTTLHIRGQRQETAEEKGEGYIRRETFFGTFERALPLPGGVKAEDLRANYNDGVLEILTPGAAKRPTQRVLVESGSHKKK